MNITIGTNVDMVYQYFTVLVCKEVIDWDAHAVALAHAKTLEYENAKYPLQRVECKTFSVPAGGRDVTQEKIFTGQLPTRVVVGCVDNEAFNGVFKKNPFTFQNYKISRISFHVDGEEK